MKFLVRPFICRCVKRIAVSFSRPAGGFFSHFAHFISDFVLPLHSLLERQQLMGDDGIVLELPSRPPDRLGPLLPVAQQIFPGLDFVHVPTFSCEPIQIQRRPWHNHSRMLDKLIKHLCQTLSLKPTSVGVVVVKRGLDRTRYPGHNFMSSSGADRRNISAGFEDMLVAIKEKRADTVCVVLEELSFSEQVSLFLNADTLVAQHGAAFVHAHWMPRRSHLIELQCRRMRGSPRMVPTIARLRGHLHSIVDYPCQKQGFAVDMRIDDVTAVSRLIENKKEPASLHHDLAGFSLVGSWLPSH